MTTDNYVIVTGATGAIGVEICRALCRKATPLLLACRNESKANNLIQRLRAEFPEAKLEFLSLDLADQRSIEQAAASLNGKSIAGLINNAGVMERNFRLNSDGREMDLSVNYFNTMNFTEQIIPMLSNGSAIVFTTSLTRFLHRSLPSEIRVNESNFSQLGTYGLSKRLITDYASRLSASLAYRNIRVNCADPGIVDTGMITMKRWFDSIADLLFRPFIRKPAQGAEPALRAFAACDSGKIYCRRATHKMPAPLTEMPTIKPHI